MCDLCGVEAMRRARTLACCGNGTAGRRRALRLSTSPAPTLLSKSGSTLSWVALRLTGYTTYVLVYTVNEKSALLKDTYDMEHISPAHWTLAKLTPHTCHTTFTDALVAARMDQMRLRCIEANDAALSRIQHSGPYSGIRARLRLRAEACVHVRIQLRIPH